MKKILFFILGLGFLASCSPKIVSVGEEDLTQYRNKYQYEREQYAGTTPNQIIDIPLEFDSTTQEYHITFELNRLLDKPLSLGPVTSGVRRLDGWRIQIYRGRSQSEASRARERCYELFSTRLTPYIEYKSPTYRVKVGDFLEPYEYQPFLKVLKREFPSAIVVPDIIKIIVQGRPAWDRDGTPTPQPSPNQEITDQENKK